MKLRRSESRLWTLKLDLKWSPALCEENERRPTSHWVPSPLDEHGSSPERRIAPPSRPSILGHRTPVTAVGNYDVVTIGPRKAHALVPVSTRNRDNCGISRAKPFVSRGNKTKNLVSSSSPSSSRTRNANFDPLVHDDLFSQVDSNGADGKSGVVVSGYRVNH